MTYDPTPQNEWTKHQWNEHNIRTYCRCGWVLADNDVDGESRTLTFLNPDCRLHGTDPKHDLPEVIP